MKKNFLMLFVGISFLSTITTTTNAQLFAANSSYKLPGNTTSHAETKLAVTKEDVKDAKAAAKLAKANLNALSNLKSQFKGAANVKWSIETETITACFNQNEIQTRVVYDKKGRWIRNMHVYDESKMPVDVRALVKRSEFYDYKIAFVQQFKEYDLQFYLVHLEKDGNYKQLCVCEGEYKVIKEFKIQTS
ncbi:MAG: hypothetical protein JWQ96_1786 [Segetibacter sp.]|nr:hypothetical protein [Segetibacter sp.]